MSIRRLTSVASILVTPAAIDILLDQAPDPVLDGVKARFALETQRARSLDRDRDDLLHLARPTGEDDDAVGQIDRLVDLVGDKQHGLAGLGPDPQQLLLHRLTGLRIE